MTPRLLLTILNEESAEVLGVIHAASKVLRFGWDRTYPDGTTNRQRLEQEIGDWLGVVEMLYERGVISEEKVQAYARKKRLKLLKYHGKDGDLPDSDSPTPPSTKIGA